MRALARIMNIICAEYARIITHFTMWHVHYLRIHSPFTCASAKGVDVPSALNIILECTLDVYRFARDAMTLRSQETNACKWDCNALRTANVSNLIERSRSRSHVINWMNYAHNRKKSIYLYLANLQYLMDIIVFVAVVVVAVASPTPFIETDTAACVHAHVGHSNLLNGAKTSVSGARTRRTHGDMV